MNSGRDETMRDTTRTIVNVFVRDAAGISADVSGRRATEYPVLLYVGDHVVFLGEAGAQAIIDALAGALAESAA